MVTKYVNWLLRRQAEVPSIPECHDHHVQMRLRGMMGRPTQFSRQTEEEYTFLYFCPVEGCNETAAVTRPSSQAPGTGEAPPRPVYARPRD
jgi:hypothetical protein